MVKVSVLRETPMSDAKRLIHVQFAGITDELPANGKQKQALAVACAALKLETDLRLDEEGDFVLVFDPGLSDDAQEHAAGVFEESFLNHYRKKHPWVSSYRQGKEPH